MSLQTIIDNAMSIEFVRRKLAGQSISRSGQVKISSVANNVPWQMIVEPRPGMRWTESRDLIEEIDRLDRVFLEVVDIGNTNPNLAYITNYQGTLTGSELSSITVSSASALTITLNVSSFTGASKVVFEPGDFIQLSGNYKYPYTVTSRVLRGSGSTVEVPINRPFIDQTGYTEAGAGILVGKNVTWQMVMTKKPSYRVVPGGYLEWTDNFELVEVIED
jgi:hypothetical protein|nr:MAG TPA: hypothetical protein [Caudoviricetes sp.]